MTRYPIADAAQERLYPVAQPATILHGGVRPGDVLVRSALAEGILHSAVLVSERVESAAELARRGLPVELAGQGGYVEVVETPFGGGPPRSVGRRLVDARGQMPHGQTLLRPGDVPEGLLERRPLTEPALLKAEVADRLSHSADDIETAIESISSESIRYLSLEGGGGKGFAFLGALDALRERGVLVYEGDHGLVPGSVVGTAPQVSGPLQGVAGSSAGAITAMLIATGYTYEAIRQIMVDTDFVDFYDLPRPGARPVPFHGVSGGENVLGKLARRAIAAAIGASPAAALPGALLSAASNLTEPPFSRWFDKRYVLDYLACLRSDYGFHTGLAARRLFDGLIARGLRILNQRRRVLRPETDFGSANFATHFAVTGIKLVVTGANISTGKSEFFSVDTTPDFPVADAVRISMSIPIAFKPVFIEDPQRQGVWRGRGRLRAQDLRGLWVDGGTFNNQPIRAFGDVAHTLAIRLDIGESATIDNLGQYLKALIKGAVFSGEAHISRSWGNERRSIELSTKDLDTLDFKPDKNTREARINDAKDLVLRRVTRGRGGEQIAREEGSFLDTGGVTASDDRSAIETLPDLSAWRELISHRPTADIQRMVRSKVTGAPLWAGWPFQTIENKATGPINLDYYPITVTRLPRASGHEIPAPQLLQLLRLNFNRFVDTRFANFEPFNEDRALFRSNNPLGALVHIDMRVGSALANPDDGSVAVTLAEQRRWIFSTLWTLRDAAHPVSGNREFGYTQREDGAYVFYTRGADRTARLIDRALSGTVFSQAHALWLSLQQGIAGYVRTAGGAADIGTAVSNRYGWDQIRTRYFRPTRTWL